MPQEHELASIIITDYANGYSLNAISLVYGVSGPGVLRFLREFKERSTRPNAYTDDFKRLIATRDEHPHITRRSIARELGINTNTVKRACEQFGKALKERNVTGQEFTRIDGDHPMTACPSCASRMVNTIDPETVFCKSCGDEHVFKKGYILKVNFEYFE